MGPGFFLALLNIQKFSFKMIPPFEIQRDEENELIVVEFHAGQDSYQMRMQCIEHMQAANKDANYSRLIIDLRKISRPMELINQFTIGEKVVNSQLQSMKTAVIHNESGANPNDVITLVSGNRGRLIKNFLDKTEAIEWLKS